MILIDKGISLEEAMPAKQLMIRLWNIIADLEDSEVEKAQLDFESFVLNTHPITLRITRYSFYTKRPGVTSIFY